MPRTARIAPGGMVFHVLNRANNRMPIFEQYEYWTYPLFFSIPFSFPPFLFRAVWASTACACSALLSRKCYEENPNGRYRFRQPGPRVTYAVRETVSKIITSSDPKCLQIVD